MDFALPLLFVVPSANSIPTTGSTQDLTAGQTGIFRSDYSVGTAGNIASQPYIYVAQGRADKSTPTLRTDKIAASKIINWQKVSGGNTAIVEIWNVSQFNIQKGQPVTLSINAHSFYLDSAFNNGYSKSVVVTPDCFECGDDACDTVPNETVIDAIIKQVYEDFNFPTRSAGALAQFFDFTKEGTGSSAVLVITAKPLTAYGQPCDLAAFPYLFDRLWFRTFVFQGPDTTADFIVADACNQAAVADVVQRSDYPKLTSDEVYQLEKDYHSYGVSKFKEIFRFPGYSPTFESFTETGVVYNQYLIDWLDYDGAIDSFNEASKQVSRAILLVPNTITNIETVLTAYLGAPALVGGTQSTTTTTTSTSSSSTSTTTSTLIP